MTDSELVEDPLPPAPSNVRRSVMQQGLTVCGFVLLIGLYLAIVSGGFYHFYEDSNYYNLLADAFLSGQTYLKAVPPPDLVTAFEAKDYENLTNQGVLIDTALYKGKYYIYFGPTPAVMCAAWKLASGGTPCQGIPLMLVFTVVATVGMYIALRTLDDLQGTPWPVGRWFVFITFAFGAFQLYLLCFPRIYHIAISAGMGFTLCAYALFLRYLSGTRAPRLMLLAIGTLLALAFSSRIVTIFYAGCLTLVLAWIELRRPGLSWQQAILRLGICIAPMAAMAIMLLIYNWMRFDNPLEFGITYTLTTNPTRTIIDEGRLFSPSYMLQNLNWYFFSLAPVSPDFPFLALRETDVFPFTYALSAFLIAPVILLALVAVFLLVARRLHGFVATATLALASGSLVTGLYILGFVGVSKRYAYDFLPIWYLLAYVGLHRLHMHWPRSRAWRIGGVVTLSGLGIWSVAMGLLLGITTASIEFPPYLQIGHWQRRLEALVTPSAQIPIDLSNTQGYPPDFQRIAIENLRTQRAFVMAWGGEITTAPIQLAAGAYDLQLEHFSYSSTKDNVYAQFYVWAEAEGQPLIPLTERRLWESSPNAGVDRVASFYLPVVAPVRIHIAYVNDATGSLSDRNLYLSALWLRASTSYTGTLFSQLDLHLLSGYPVALNRAAVEEVQRSGHFPMAWQGAVTYPSLDVVPGTYELVIRHVGTPWNGEYPQFKLHITSNLSNTQDVVIDQDFTSSNEVRYDRSTSFRIDKPTSLGITISFLNDGGSSTEDRNLILYGLYLIKR